MATERSTEEMWAQHPDWKAYDEAYAEWLEPYVSGKVLDLGSGAGLFTNRYAKRKEVKSVLGVDKYIDDATPSKKVTYRQGELPSAAGAGIEVGAYDTVVSTEFIEHITRDDLNELLGLVKSAIAPNGIFIGSTPNTGNGTNSDNPYHLYEYREDELRDILLEHFDEVRTDNARTAVASCIVWVASKVK